MSPDEPVPESTDDGPAAKELPRISSDVLPACPGATLAATAVFGDEMTGAVHAPLSLQTHTKKRKKSQPTRYASRSAQQICTNTVAKNNSFRVCSAKFVHKGHNSGICSFLEQAWRENGEEKSIWHINFSIAVTNNIEQKKLLANNQPYMDIAPGGSFFGAVHTSVQNYKNTHTHIYIFTWLCLEEECTLALNYHALKVLLEVRICCQYSNVLNTI